MIRGLLGKKIGMTQVFDEKGNVLPVTVIQAGPCVVTAIRTPKREGYTAVQLGFEEKKTERTTQPELGHFQKASTTPKRFVREVEVDSAEEVELGQLVDLSIFDGCRKVSVIGITKGRGFQGVMKRHGFSRGPVSHGSKNIRKPGSIGQSAFPSRVIKGKKLPGRMGPHQVTVKGLEVVRIDKERNLLIVKGAVPGANNGYLVIKCER